MRLLLLVWCLAAAWSPACELCAIYNSSGALCESDRGWTFAVAEQYIPYRTSQYNGQEVQFPPAYATYVDSSITHLVPGYNFSSRFGLNFNLPVTHLNFRRTDLRYSLTAPPVLVTDTGTEFGLGDPALIGRVTVLQQRSMAASLMVNALAGVKFPTGNSERLEDEVGQARLFESFLPPGTPHDPLAHSPFPVHQHDLALGSGSFDGVFGLTANARWRRAFFNTQFQYYLRSEGTAGFRYGDEWMVSGGPGLFVFLKDSWTLSLQLNAVYDVMGHDQLLGQISYLTGMTACYLGPLVNFTWGKHFTANVGLDVPLVLNNNGSQDVPDYRLQGGVSWRF